MKKTQTLPLVLFGLIAATGTSGAVVLATIGVYDSAVTNANQVDRNATGNSLASLGGNDVGGFTPDVLAAYNANFGGVITFDELTAGGSNNNLATALQPVYGVGGTKTIAIVVSTLYNIQGSTNLAPISGSNSLFNSTSTVNSYSLTFGAITATTGNPAPDPLEAVTRVGFTIISRASGNPTTPVVTANFSDGTFAIYDSSSFTSPGAGSTLPEEDTFYGFTAPAGASISNIAINFGAGDADRRRPIDDIAFITTVIPEPSSSALVATGAALVLVRRRRL